MSEEEITDKNLSDTEHKNLSDTEREEVVGFFLQDSQIISRELMPESPKSTVLGKVKKDVLHTLVIKKIVDDGDNLELHATLIQRVFGLNEDDVGFEFDYRINEDRRKFERIETDPIKDNLGRIVGTRSAFEVKIPLIVDLLVPRFPYQIFQATATIELSSKKYRPNLLLSSNRRDLVQIRQLPPGKGVVASGLGLKGEKKNNKASLVNEIMDRIDQTLDFNFLSPHPLVYYHYDTKQQYCSRFSLSFYIITDGFEKWVKTVMPMFLVFVIAAVNLWIDFYRRYVDQTYLAPEKYISVVRGLAMTVVFLLPHTRQRGKRKGSAAQDRFIVIFFSALIIMSFPTKLIGTPALEVLGVSIMAALFVYYPFWNTYDYYKIKRRARCAADKQHNNIEYRFLSDKTYRKMEFDKDTHTEDRPNIDEEGTTRSIWRNWDKNKQMEDLHPVKDVVEKGVCNHLYRVEHQDDEDARFQSVIFKCPTNVIEVPGKEKFTQPV